MIEEMTLEELWQLFPIILTPFDDRWKFWAEEEIALLKVLLEPVRPDMEYHHIGSTAIKGIWAKPTVDIIVATHDIADFYPIKITLLNAGYLMMNESKGRMCMVKGYTLDGFSEKVFHIHIRLSGDMDEVYFRDYLNSHHDVAKEYEALKLSLWKKFEHNRDRYTSAKTDFVKRYTTISKSSLTQT